MNKIRPVNVNLLTIRFPLPAIVSILHRISGVILFILAPLYIWLFQYSLSYLGYEHLQTILREPAARAILWCFALPFLYHLLAGIRHLLADIHIGTNTIQQGKFTSAIVFILFIIFSILLGIALW